MLVYISQFRYFSFITKTKKSVSVDPEDSPPSRRLNIARLIMLYVKKFEITNPLEAIHYYYMLRNLQTLDRQNLFMVCVGDLAQETRDYELIFGKIMPNGLRSQGLIDQFVSSSLSTESLAEMVANELVKKGLYEDAIKLYDLADVSTMKKKKNTVFKKENYIFFLSRTKKKFLVYCVRCCHKSFTYVLNPDHLENVYKSLVTS